MPDWRERAACLEADPELFFPIGETGPSRWQIAEAKLVCGSCEVRATCLELALRTDSVDGIWGGLSADERKRLRRGSPARGGQPRRVPLLAP